jgi:hypothetical protein
MAASRRSAALAYRIGSPRHDSRYSAIGISVSRRASKVRCEGVEQRVVHHPSLVRFMPRTAVKRGASASRRVATNQRCSRRHSFSTLPQHVKVCSLRFEKEHPAKKLGPPTVSRSTSCYGLVDGTGSNDKGSDWRSLRAESSSARLESTIAHCKLCEFQRPVPDRCRCENRAVHGTFLQCGIT